MGKGREGWKEKRRGGEGGWVGEVVGKEYVERGN